MPFVSTWKQKLVENFRCSPFLPFSACSNTYWEWMRAPERTIFSFNGPRFAPSTLSKYTTPFVGTRIAALHIFNLVYQCEAKSSWFPLSLYYKVPICTITGSTCACLPGPRFFRSLRIKLAFWLATSFILSTTLYLCSVLFPQRPSFSTSHTFQDHV